MFFKVQAVFPKPDSPVEGSKGVRIGSKHIFVSNTGKPKWCQGKAVFFIPLNGYGEPLDYQVLLIDPRRHPEGIVPVVYRDGEFRPLPPCNTPRNEWQTRQYKFGGAEEIRQDGQVVSRPLYVVRVRPDGSAVIVCYELDHNALSVEDGVAKIPLQCRTIFRTNKLHPDEEVVRCQLPIMAADMTKYLFAAYRSAMKQQGQRERDKDSSRPANDNNAAKVG